MIGTAFRDWLLVVWLCGTGAALAADRPVDYSRDIRPILARNCFACHGPDEEVLQAELRLDLRDSAPPGQRGAAAVISPGKPRDSKLFLRISTRDDSERMPPADSGHTLTRDQVGLIRRWIEQGADYSTHWSFRPVALPEVPVVQSTAWPRNGADYFILHRLEQAGIQPSFEADRLTLIRRLSLDLTGLPPSQPEVDEFINDRRPDAYERLVDRLLDSPHFGERWGRHWLDLARYADSDGYLGDDLRPDAYRYRDWVIDAINRDLPFDQFTIEQLAGDLLENATLAQKTATGFHRNAMKNTEAGVDKAADRVIRTVDRLSTVGTVWMGLTVGCAECHSHKYDPISHREFYQLYAFFDGLEDRDIEFKPPVELAQSGAAPQANEEVEQIRVKLKQSLAEVRSPPAVERLLQLLGTPQSQRSEEDREALERALDDLDARDRQLADQYQMVLAIADKGRPAKCLTVGVAKKQPITHVHLRGDFRRPGDEVEPSTPAFLPPLQPRGARADRLDLARWLVDSRHPLTSRAAVNHVWKHLFGRGIVDTEENLGTSGSDPSHPELLDWLASQFMDCGLRIADCGLEKNKSEIRNPQSEIRNRRPPPLQVSASPPLQKGGGLGWSRKALIRLIVNSAAYRQASHARPDLLDVDPQNILVARQSRYRVEAEVVRDLALAAGGLLNRKIGGPSILPPMRSRVTAISRNQEWNVSAGTEKHRRGLYILFRRATPFPMLTLFDAPDSTVTCADRERSNSPLQALTLLNDPVFFECAQQLGRRLAEMGPASAESWIAQAFQLCLSRPVESAELQRLLAYALEQRSLLKNVSADELSQLIGEPVAGIDPREHATRVIVARGIMNLDEFITRE